MSIVRQYKNIVSFKDSSGKTLAFHSQNLEVAEIDQEAWSAFESQSGEAFNEIASWSEEVNDQVSDSYFEDHINQLSINVSQICNLACTYCAADGGTYKAQKPIADLNIVYKQLDQFLKPIKDGGSFHIRFFGGEPLLYPDHIKKMADYAKLLVAGRDIDLRMKITTNGTLIDEKRAQLLADYNMEVAISIDGPEQINDQTRPAKNKKSTTQMIIEGLKTLAKHRDQLKTLRVITVFGEHNLDVMGTYGFLKQFNFDSYSFSYARSENDVTVSPQFMKNFKETIYFILKTYGINEVLKIIPIRNFVLRLQYQARNLNHCGVGKSSIQSDTSGNLFGCNWWMSDSSEVIGKGAQIFKDKVAPFKKDLVDLHNCQTCWAKNLCGGGCMFVNKQSSGEKHIKDKFFCERTKEQAQIGLEIFNRFSLQN